MTIDESVAHVKRLLCMLPGVEIAWTQTKGGRIRFGLVIRNEQSLALLVHVTVASNIPLGVEIDWGCPGGHDDPNCVRYDIRIPVEPPPADPASNLEFFGGMFARRLAKRGLVRSEEVAPLLEAWNVAFED